MNLGSRIAAHLDGTGLAASALSFHGLTDQIPAKVWMAIGPKDWRPRLSYPAARFVHFPQARLATDVEQHFIEGVSVAVEGLRADADKPSTCCSRDT